MNKLTKEQGEMMRLAFDEAHKKNNHDLFHIIDCRSIINRCVGHPFPYIEFENKDGVTLELNGSVHKKDHILIAMSFKGVKGAVACMDVSHETFKELTKSFEDVVGWIDGQ